MRKEGWKKVKEERNWIDVFRGIPLSPGKRPETSFTVICFSLGKDGRR